MTKILSAQEARNTKIFAICYNGVLEVEEMSLFEFVAESAEETTSPRGVMHKLFVNAIDGGIYRLIGTEKTIDENQYGDLLEEDQELYEFLGETTIMWGLYIWENNGHAKLVAAYGSEEDANDEWYTRTYNYDFGPDDQRDTRYWFTEEEAEKALEEMMKED